MMGLKDIIRAIREYPTAHADLEAVRFELRHARQELDRSEQDRESLSLTLLEREDYTDFLSHKAEALQDALKEFCPRLSAPEELKRFYDTISPSMDASGSTLYRIAKELTGIDVPSLFPYEDNRGLFEVMEGHQLLNWLTAVRFGAVEWEIVTGTCYEKALLREVDTSTPEYQAFECSLYRKVLDRMGFGDLLVPEEVVKSQGIEVSAIENQPTELKLYSPLSGELAGPEHDRREALDGSGLAAFRDVILQGIEDERMPEEEERGLMAYFDGTDVVNEKVLSLFPTVENMDGMLCGVAVCRIHGKLSPDELAELKEYCAAQYNDSWGEGFAQRPRHTEYGDLYVSFHTDSGASILAKEELERASAVISRQMKRGGESR